MKPANTVGAVGERNAMFPRAFHAGGAEDGQFGIGQGGPWRSSPGRVGAHRCRRAIAPDFRRCDSRAPLPNREGAGRQVRLAGVAAATGRSRSQGRAAYHLRRLPRPDGKRGRLLARSPMAALESCGIEKLKPNITQHTWLRLARRRVRARTDCEQTRTCGGVSDTATLAAVGTGGCIRRAARPVGGQSDHLSEELKQNAKFPMISHGHFSRISVGPQSRKRQPLLQ